MAIDLCAVRWLPCASQERLIASPLVRHLTTFHLNNACAHWNQLSSEFVEILARHAPNLQSLQCAVTLTPNEPLVLPAHLVSLKLALDGEYTDATINGVLTVIAALPSLAQLCLLLAAFADDNSVQLNLLAACPSLTGLELASSHYHTPKFTETQVEQIRSSLGHLHHLSVGLMDSSLLARLL